VPEFSDDDLLQILQKAANGNIARHCGSVRPIRKMLRRGIPLEAIVACFRYNVAHLKSPLKAFNASFIGDEALAHAKAMAVRREDAKPIELVFVPIDSPFWPLVEARYLREHRRRPPGNATGPDGNKSRPGWWFPASWPECHPPPREAAE
jgi:hypothetical protein